METSLSITSVQESDGGVYQCVVTNGIGVATANELLIAKSNSKRMDFCTVPQSIALFHMCDTPTFSLAAEMMATIFQ